MRKPNLLERTSNALLITAFVIITGSSIFSLTEGYLPEEFIMLQQFSSGLAVGFGAVNAIDKMAKEND